MGDMCVHMLDMARWMLDLGPVDRVFSEGGILTAPEAKANAPDTQTATFTFGDLPIVWTHRTWGSAPDPEYPWAAFIYGENGVLKASVDKYDFVPRNKKSEALHADAVLEPDKYPDEQDEPRFEAKVAAGSRAHLRNFLRAIDAYEAGGRRPPCERPSRTLRISRS